MRCWSVFATPSLGPITVTIKVDESSPEIRVPFLSHWYVRPDPVGSSAEHWKVRFVPMLTGLQWGWLSQQH